MLLTRSRTLIAGTAVAMVALLATPATTNAVSPAHDSGRLLVSGLQGGSGSTVGPDGALYVPETVAGRIDRVSPRTGAVTTFAEDLPKQIIGLGGVMDVAFIHHTAYALVTLVGPDVGGTDVDGIYRIDGRHQSTVVADIGAFAIAHPPTTPFDVPSGVQYSMQRYRGGFLVTDGHHNRVYRVSLDGRVRELIAFGDIVPTGLEKVRHRIYMAEAGPVPHQPWNGKIVTFDARNPSPARVASGARLLTDVELGPHHRLYALAQGHFTPGHDPGSPADPNKGKLLKVNRDGTFTQLVRGIDRPTSLEFIGHTAYVVTLSGQIWRIRHVPQLPGI